MIRRLAAVLTATAAVLLGTVATAPASSADDYYAWGKNTQNVYQYGNRVHGEARADVWVDNWDDDLDGDGLGDRELIRGHARICKVSKVSRVQVDLVRLGNYTHGGVLAENLTPKNSGTATCTESTTAWVEVASLLDCADTFEAITRGKFAIRWSNTGRLSQVSFLSNPSGWEWCQMATAQKDN